MTGGASDLHFAFCVVIVATFVLWLVAAGAEALLAGFYGLFW